MTTPVGKNSYDARAIVPTGYLGGMSLGDLRNARANLGSQKPALAPQNAQATITASATSSSTSLTERTVALTAAEVPYSFWNAWIQPVVDAAYTGGEMAYNGAVGSAEWVAAVCGLSPAQQVAVAAELDRAIEQAERKA